MNAVTYEEAPFGAGGAEVAAPRAQRLDERALSILERYWQAVYVRRLVIAIVMALSVTVGVIAYLLATPEYRATARIEISRGQPKITNLEGILEDRGRDAQYYETQYNLLRAQSLAERVVRVLGLQNDDSFFEVYSGGTASPTAGSAPKRQRSAAEQTQRLQIAAAILLSSIEVKPVGTSNLVDISFMSPNAALAARVSNAWAQEYIQANLDRRFAATADARGFLEQRLNQLRTRLEASERELVAYASGRGIVSLASASDGQGRSRSDRTLVGDELTALNNALSEATAERISAESSLRASANNPTGPGQTALAGLRQHRAELAARYSALLTKFEPGYPEAEALRSEIYTIDQSIAAEAGRSRSDTEASFRSAATKEAKLRAQLEELKNTYNVQRSNLIQYTILEREVDTNRQLYDGLLQRYKEIGVAGVGTNNVAIVDPAQTPGGPVEPNLPRNILVALLVGIILSGGLVVVAEEIDQSLRDPAEVQRDLGLPLLGTIPRVDDKEVVAELGDKKTQLYESYLAVRTNLSFLTDHGAPRVFMLTSSRPNEGKSLSAFALARMFGETGARTILIDADMRNTRLEDLIVGTRGPGLSNYLSGATGIEEIVQRPDTQSFSVITAGPTPPNAAELLASDRFRDLLASLTRDYDHVIIDAPPVLGLADAPLLSRVVDGVLFVIESNVGKLRVVRSALRRLELPGARIFGAIVTKLDARNMSYGYGYGYGSGYGYGYGRGNSRSTPAAQDPEEQAS